MGLHDVRHAHVTAHIHIGMGGYSEGKDMPRFSVHHVLGQAEIGYGHARRAAQHGGGLEHRHVMTEKTEKIGAGHAGGAGTDDGHLSAGIGKGRQTGNHGSIGGKTFQRTNGDAFIIFAAVALEFAGMRAYAAGDAGEGIAAQKHGMSLFRSAVLEQGFHGLNSVSRRAVRLAGRRSALTLLIS